MAFAVTTDDGWILRGDVERVEGAPIVAVCAHAMMTNRRSMMSTRRESLVGTLVGSGMSVVNVDLRGHGESGPTVREGGSYTYDDFVLRDWPAILGEVRRQFEGARVAVVGHSLGGHTALLHSGLRPAEAPHAIVGLGANMWLPSTEPNVLRRKVKGQVLSMWAAVARKRGCWDPAWTGGRGEAEPLAYIEQFDQMYRTDQFRSVDGEHDYVNAMRSARLPVLALASEGDRLLAHPDAVRRYTGLAEDCDVLFRIVSSSDLAGPAPGHMGLVTDSRMVGVWREIVRWLERACR